MPHRNSDRQACVVKRFIRKSALTLLSKESLINLEIPAVWENSRKTSIQFFFFDKKLIHG